MNGSFTVGAGALAAAVKYTSRWLAAKPIIPAHAGLLFEVDVDRLNIFGYNENATARATVAIDVQDEPKGGFVVAGRLIAGLVETFPEKDVRFEQDGEHVTVSVGRFRATLPVMPDRDYPALPGTAPVAGIVDGSALADAAGRVAAAASKDLINRAALACVHLTFGEESGEPLVLMATDTYHAARQVIDWEPSPDSPAAGQSALILSATLTDAAEALAGADEVAIGWDKGVAGEGVISFSTPTRSLVSRTLGDPQDFPASTLTPMFSAARTAAATIAIRDLVLPLKRAGVLRGRESDAVTVRFTPGLATILIEMDNNADEEVDIYYDGPETTVMLKSSILQSLLGSVPGPMAVLSFNPDTFKPVIVTSPTDPSWRHILVPLRPVGGK